jgi:hypothetical protein
MVTFILVRSTGYDACCGSKVVDLPAGARHRALAPANATA